MDVRNDALRILIVSLKSWHFQQFLLLLFPVQSWYSHESMTIDGDVKVNTNVRRDFAARTMYMLASVA